MRTHKDNFFTIHFGNRVSFLPSLRAAMCEFVVVCAGAVIDVDLVSLIGGVY